VNAPETFQARVLSAIAATPYAALDHAMRVIWLAASAIEGDDGDAETVSTLLEMHAVLEAVRLEVKRYYLPGGDIMLSAGYIEASDRAVAMAKGLQLYGEDHDQFVWTEILRRLDKHITSDAAMEEIGAAAQKAVDDGKKANRHVKSLGARK
jgi:hypothetical protein